LSLPRRQRVHLQIAAAMEQAYASTLDRHAGDLAHHLYQAGAAADPEKTARYLALAADQALAASAFEDALRYVEQALAIEAGGDVRRDGELLAKKGAALLSLGREEDAITEWQTALSIYERLRDVDAVARICYEMGVELDLLNRKPEGADICARGLRALGDDRTAGCWRLLALTGFFAAELGDYEAGIRMLEDAEHAVERLGDRHLLGQVLSSRVTLCLNHAESRQVVDVGRRAAGELRRVGGLWELTFVLSLLEMNLVWLGRLDEAATCDDELRPLARRLGHRLALFLADWASMERELMRTGDLDAYEAAARQALDACLRAAQAGPIASFSYVFVGAAQFWKGQWDSSLISFERAIQGAFHPPWIETAWGWLFLVKAYAAAEDAPQVFGGRQAALPAPGMPAFSGSWHLAQLAVEGLAILGDKREAHALYPTLLRLMGMRVGGWVVGLVATSAGIAAACGADWNAAEQHFQTALRQADEIPHKIAQPETRRWYAQMLLDRNAPGDRDRARTLLDEAIEMYRQIGMPKHLEIAERMLGGL
ncbi:MAG: hypothetical protein HYS05_10390, partial [Acidobacteria bacterium]|nr:hypothetical protein [Acidobacteriota bacterium]